MAQVIVLVGWSGLVGFALMLLAIPATKKLGVVQMVLGKRRIMASDKRLSLVTELLQVYAVSILCCLRPCRLYLLLPVFFAGYIHLLPVSFAGCISCCLYPLLPTSICCLPGSWLLLAFRMHGCSIQIMGTESLCWIHRASKC